MSEDCCLDSQVDEKAGDGRPSVNVWIDRAWMAAITGFLFVMLFRDELSRLMDRWGTAKESHGLLIPAFSLYFLYQDRGRLEKLIGKPSYFGLVVLIGGVFGYLFFFYVGMLYPRQIMMLVVMVGIVLLLGGWRVLMRVWLPIAFLLFAIPMPQGIYTSVSKPLRELASLVAAMILDAIPGISAESAGVLIHGTHLGVVFDLNVAEACSGMRLLQAFLALGVAMAYLEYRPIIHRLVLLCSTIPIAIFCNMLRVLVTGLIHIYIGKEYATGMLHTLLGMGMLIVAFGLYGLLAWVMNRIFIEDDSGEVLIVGGQEGVADTKADKGQS